MSLKISIVIPVYNEADQLEICLQSIARQTRKPYEVIVVDNNSTDESIEIARHFDFVTVLSEPRQGVVHARNTGFNAARGEIIGRIDADSRLQPDWAEVVAKTFTEDSVACISGTVRYHDMSFKRAANATDLFFRRWLAKRLDNEIAMQGANMALRRSVWQVVRAHVCDVSGMHEDFDLGIHIAKLGGKLAFVETMIASVGFRQVDGSFHGFSRYVLLSPETYRQHGLKSQRYFYPIVYLVLSGFLLLKLAHQSYDADLEGFSWRKLFENKTKARVNPATFVD